MSPPGKPVHLVGPSVTERTQRGECWTPFLSGPASRAPQTGDRCARGTALPHFACASSAASGKRTHPSRRAAGAPTSWRKRGGRRASPVACRSSECFGGRAFETSDDGVGQWPSAEDCRGRLWRPGQVWRSAGDERVPFASDAVAGQVDMRRVRCGSCGLRITALLPTIFHEHPRVAVTNSVCNSGRDSTRPLGPAITTVPVESRGGAYPVGIGGSSGAFATGPQSDSREHVSSPRSPNPAGRSPAPGSPVESCDSHTGSRSRPADGSRERWHHAHTLALAGRCVVRPVDALATATMQVVPFACACDDCEHNRAAARPVLTLPTTDFVSWD